MTTTYLSRTVLDQLDQAQAEIDRHVTTNAAGRCVTCGELEPCRARAFANSMFVRFGRLPQRRPGEVVRLWSVDACGARGFPPPLNPNRDTSFYSWAEVSRWVRNHTRHDPGPDEEPVLAAMNLALQLRRLLPRLSQPQAVLNLIQPTAASISPGCATAA